MQKCGLHPILRSLFGRISLDLGYAHSYGDDPYPFFQNYYVGGSSSVRGYKAASIGKQFYDDHKKILYRREVQQRL